MPYKNHFFFFVPLCLRGYELFRLKGIRMVRNVLLWYGVSW